MTPSPNPVYMYPVWGLPPDRKNGEFAVHCTVEFKDDDAKPVDVLHHFELPWGEKFPPPEWVEPVMVINPLSGGTAAPRHTVKVLDGNTIQIGRCATGPGTALLLDVWMFRPFGSKKSFLGL